MAAAAGPMDQGWGWSTSYYQILGDDFSCGSDEVRYDVEFVDSITDAPVNAPALLVLFDRDSGTLEDVVTGSNGYVGSVCFDPDEHEISVSIDETSTHHAYWSMYREENPGDIPREKHIVGKVWLIDKTAPQADYEHTFPSIGTDEILDSSPDFEATVNQLPNLLGASDLSEATVFVYDLIGLSLVDTYTTSISSGLGVKDLGTVPLPDGRYSWGFYMSMDATHDAGSLLSASGQPVSSFSGLSGNFRIDSTNPIFTTFGHTPNSPDENDDVNLQILARDQTSNGYYSGIREVRVYFDGALVRTCNHGTEEVRDLQCNYNAGQQTSGTYQYYAEADDWAGNTHVSVTNTVTVAQFFNSQGTISGSGCTIPTGASSCVVNLNWSSSEFIGTPNVVNQATLSVLSTDASGSLGVPASPDTDIFRLVDTGAGTIFPGDTFNANVSCADGNAFWNGSVCALQPTGSISGSSCTIPTGGSSCLVALNWTTSNFDGAPSVYRDSTSVIISSAVSGSQLVSATPNDDIFVLIDTGTNTVFTGASYNANVTCGTAGDVWNGSSCQPQPSGSISGTTCQVPIDGSTCLINLDWTSANFFGSTEVRRGGSVISGAPSASSFSVPVSPADNVFTLTDTGVGSPFPGGSFTATVTCATGSLWDGSVCSEGAYDAYIAGLVELSCGPDEFFDDVNVVCVKIPTASITGTSCQVAPGDSTCELFLDWSLSNPVGSTVVSRGGTVLVSGTPNATGYSVNAGPDTDTFSIADNGYQLGTTIATYDANVTCTSGHFWNGSVCQAIPTGSISGVSCTIPTGDSTCDVLLSWSANNFFGTPEVRRMSPFYVALSTSLTGTDVAFPTNPDNDQFRIVDLGVGTTYPGDVYDANVTCADVDSAWDGTSCVPIPEGTISGTTCSVPTGGSTCTITLNWTTSDFVGTPRVARSDGTFISDLVSGSVPVTVSPASDVFTLEDTGAGTLFPGDVFNANVTCADLGSVWNGSTCIPEPTGGITFSSSCQILTGDSTCVAGLTWTTTNFVGSPAIRQGFSLLSNATSFTGFPVTVTHGNNQVRLEDTGSGTTFSDVAINLNVPCADPNDTWNGSVCAPDLQSGFAISGQGQQTGCPAGQFISLQTGTCELLPVVVISDETFTRFERSSALSFSIEAAYEVECEVFDGDAVNQTITHNAGGGTNAGVVSYQASIRPLESTQNVTLTCTAPGMVDPVVESTWVNVVPEAEEF